MKEWIQDEDIIVIERAEGCYLYDTSGRQYLDGVSSLWCNIHGHCVPQIDQAIKDQLEKVAHTTFLGLSHPAGIKLAERLVRIAPAGLSRVFFSDSGSEAMEIAIKIAFQFWQQSGDPKTRSKRKFLFFLNAYHGDTLGCVSIGGIDLFHKIYLPLLFEGFKARLDLSEVEGILLKHHHLIAGVVIEPIVQCAGGIIIQPEGFLRGLRALCDRYEVLLIFDEVATGFGRTGKMFACEHEDVAPDIMAIGKGLTAGYLPLAATLTTEKVFEGFLGDYAERRTFFHGHTYTANPLACAAGIANLDLFEQGHILQRLQPKIEVFSAGLKRFNELKHVGEIRHKGFICGIEIVQSKRPYRAYPFELRMGNRIILEARKRGAILRPLGDVLVLMPPLTIGEPELSRLIDILYESIKAAS